MGFIAGLAILFYLEEIWIPNNSFIFISVGVIMLPVTSQNKTQSIWRRFTGLGGGQAQDKNWVCKTQKWDWSFKNCRASSWGRKCWEVFEVQCRTGSSNQQRNCSLEDYRAYRTSKQCPTSIQKEQINSPFLIFFMWARKHGNIICHGKCCARNSNCQRNLALEDIKACEALWSKTAKDFLMDLGSCKLALKNSLQ